MKTESKYLLDTSIWILSFKSSSPESLRKKISYLLLEGKVVTCGLIILELVRGINTKEKLNEFLADFNSLEKLQFDEKVWEVSFNLSFKMKKRGRIIPATDILIASLAIRYDVVLFHSDKHFHIITENSPLKEEYYKVK